MIAYLPLAPRRHHINEPPRISDSLLRTALWCFLLLLRLNLSFYRVSKVPYRYAVAEIEKWFWMREEHCAARSEKRRGGIEAWQGVERESVNTLGVCDLTFPARASEP